MINDQIKSKVLSFNLACYERNYEVAMALLGELSCSTIKELPSELVVSLDSFCANILLILNHYNNDELSSRLLNQVEAMFEQIGDAITLGAQGDLYLKPIHALLTYALQESNGTFKGIRQLIANHYLTINAVSGINFLEYAMSESRNIVQDWLALQINQYHSESNIESFMLKMIQNDQQSGVEAFLDQGIFEIKDSIQGRSLLDHALENKSRDVVRPLTRGLVEEIKTNADQQALGQLYYRLINHVNTFPNVSVDRLLMQTLKAFPHAYQILLTDVLDEGGSLMYQAVNANDGGRLLRRFLEPYTAFPFLTQQSRDPGSIVDKLQQKLMQLTIMLPIGNQFVASMGYAISWSDDIATKSLSNDIKESMTHYLKMFCQLCLQKLTSDFIMHGALSCDALKGLQTLVIQESNIEKTQEWLNYNITSQADLPHNSLIHYLFSLNHDCLVEEVSRQEHLNCQNDSNILCTAMENDFVDSIIKRLINKQAPVNVANEEGETPLHLAVQQNRPDIVKALMHNSATNPLARTNRGLSVADYISDTLYCQNQEGDNDIKANLEAIIKSYMNDPKQFDYSRTTSCNPNVARSLCVAGRLGGESNEPVTLTNSPVSFGYSSGNEEGYDLDVADINSILRGSP